MARKEKRPSELYLTFSVKGKAQGNRALFFPRLSQAIFHKKQRYAPDSDRGQFGSHRWQHFSRASIKFAG